MRFALLAAAAVLAGASGLPAAADPPDVCAVPLRDVAVCRSGVDALCVYGWAGDLHYRLPTCD